MEMLIKNKSKYHSMKHNKHLQITSRATLLQRSILELCHPFQEASNQEK
jgi:hypothetical protein